MKREPAPFKTEADLCAAFIAAVPKEWTPYPEVEFDILLVRRSDSYQIGIEAKLKLNAHVLAQAVKGLESPWRQHQGPDFRAILVPEGEGVAGVRNLADHIGVTIIEYRPERRNVTTLRFTPMLPELKNDGWSRYWHEQVPQARCRLPEFVPDVSAGSSAPVQLTDWKIKALKLAITMEVRGPVTRADFKALGLDPRRWTDHWLIAGPDGFTPGAMPNFKAQHPRVYAELLATAEKWMPKYLAPAPRQEALV